VSKKINIHNRDIEAWEEDFQSYLHSYEMYKYKYLLKSAIHHLIRSIELRKKKLLQDHCEVVA